MIVVPPSGASPNLVLLCGEAPGRDEARLGRPFVGKSGEAQDEYLSRHGITSAGWRKTNVIQEYTEGNPDPTPDQVEYWTPRLEEEVNRTAPKLIIAVGRFAMRWFLGDDAELDACHGLPHQAGCFDPSLRHRGGPNDAVVIPIYHPAAGFYQVETRALIAWDYGRVVEALELIRTGRGHRIQFRVDPHNGRERYIDVGGEELAYHLHVDDPEEIGYDTEGVPGAEWSLQVSTSPGTAYVLRPAQSDFHLGIATLQSRVNDGCLVITHDASTPMGCLYDTRMSRGMGLDLSRARQWNTMYAAYLLRLEPKGLKALMWRWCGMRSEDYMGLIGNISRDKQVQYLVRAAMHQWPTAEPFCEVQPDGTMKLKKPKSVNARINNILKDIWEEKRNKDGELPDPWKRWRDVDKSLRRPVEEEMGKMPTGTLDDVPLDRAVFYAGRDADATLRLKRALVPELHRMGLDRCMATGNGVLPIFEEMQHVGMPASRQRFKELSLFVGKQMREIQSKISHQYYDDRPFNPNSDKQTAALLRREGLNALKRTPTGRLSMSEKSIGHHRKTSSAVFDLFEYRQRSKVKSTYCDPLLEIADRAEPDPENPDIFRVHCKLKPASVTTRRLAAEDPSLLNQPSRTELGRRVRACYVTTGDERFGSWDFSSQEMRVAAHVSADPLLCLLFRTCTHCDQLLPRTDPCKKSPNGKHKAKCPHIAAASRIFGVRPEDVDKDGQRTPTKTANFGILYGLSGQGLLDLFRSFGLDWALDDCDALIKEILKDVYPGLDAAIKGAAKEARRTGMIRDLYGMIRYLPSIYSRDRGEAAEAARQAFSHIIQGTAQGMMQEAMVYMKEYIWALRDAGYPVWWALQIHDEVLLLFKERLFGTLHPFVLDALSNHHGLKLRVPIEAEGKMATSWEALK